MPRILVVDDDPQIQKMLRGQLSARGYEVLVAGNGADALLAAADEEPHLVILDISMPGMDGIEVCRQLREWSPIPIILLTAMDSTQSKIAALDFGADDYLTKPFHMGELLARIRAVMRRAGDSGASSAPVLSAGDLTIDLTRREARRGGVELCLTKTEFDLLREFVTHADKVLTYSHLLDAVWGAGYDDIHLVHVHVGNLRRKIERSPTDRRHLIAVPSVGYRLRTGE